MTSNKLGGLRVVVVVEVDVVGGSFSDTFTGLSRSSKLGLIKSKREPAVVLPDSVEVETLCDSPMFRAS